MKGGGKVNIIAIDLKSFYASVECRERRLDPLTTNLVVADAARTEKTICLAVSPSLKAYGIPGRARLFEVVEKVRQVNAGRKKEAPGGVLTGKSVFAEELARNPSLAVDYVVARPQMAHYMKISAKIYGIYTRYIAPEDIHVYSVDEVFMDVTHYLHLYAADAKKAGMDAVHYLALKLVREVLYETGITATAGIGTNLYLAKVAMDVVAKHVEPDSDGVRIAALDERGYRAQMWDHRPLTDFWRVGRGYARKLEAEGLYTMGDIARCSLGKPGDYYNEDLLYRLFGVNAELLIDHAWGWENCTIEAIKAYRPESTSISVGQVLHCPYAYDKARLIVREMADGLALDLVAKKLMTDQLVLSVGYDIENLSNPELRRRYKGAVDTDYYGREVPKMAHGSQNLGRFTSSSRHIVSAMAELFDRIVDRNLLVRRMYVVANHTRDEASVEAERASQSVQLDMFTDYEALAREDERRRAALDREHRQQQTVLAIKEKWGRNAILKGMNLEEGATARDRNEQVGGHRA
ncbi:MAG: DNA methylase [Clostridia bacterium]|nr:DNA methylase [Clostridia bacterium]